MALNVLGGNVPSIVNPIPFGLTPEIGIFAAMYQLQDISYDYAIGGIPFLSGESLRGTYFRRQYLRGLTPIRKDQFDSQQVPGEQSIVGWWLRSQSNFSNGAGIQYLDTTLDVTVAERYSYSEHLDTLTTPGSVSLLQGTKPVLASADTRLKLRGVNSGGVDYVLVGDGPVLKRITLAGAVTSYTMPGGVTNIVSLTDDGTNYYFADSTGIWTGAIASTGVAATKLWNVPSGSGNNMLNWVKGRLVAGLDNSVYELSGGLPPNLPTPKFTHFSSGYTFTAITAIPTAIMVSGFGGGLSQIHRFTLDASGALPVLTSGIVDAEMPTGEVINDIYGYLGSFVGIATNKGIRISTTDTSGNLVYGPLTLQNSSGVKCISGFDRFLFCGNTNNQSVPQQGYSNPAPMGPATTSGLSRIDLSQTLTNGANPFANDLDTHVTGDVVDVHNFGNSSAGWGIMAVSVSGQGVFLTDIANKEMMGMLLTGRIRYNTLEAKHFKFAYMRTNPIADGSIQMNVMDPTGGMTSIITQSAGTSTTPILIGSVGDAIEWMQLHFMVSAGTVNPNSSPVLNGYQVRALPGVDRQILLTIPVSCHDFEADRNGQPQGFDGYAYARIVAVEQLVQSGRLVPFQDLNYGTSNLVICDDYQFEQQANEQSKSSSAGMQDSNARGGYLTLKLRVVQ